MSQHKIQLLDQFHRTFFRFLILFFLLLTGTQEFQIIHTIVQSITDQVFQKIFRQIHIIVQIVKSRLRFDHPEFRQMPGRIWIFSPEGGSESIDFSQGHSSKLSFQLSTHRQIGCFTKKILSEIDFTLFCQRRIFRIQCRYPKHLAGTFTIGSRNQRSMQIKEPVLIEILMDSKRHSMTNPENSPEHIGAKTQMCMVSQKFQTMLFRLYRIFFRIGFP